MSIDQFTNEELSEINLCYCLAGRDLAFAQQLYRDQFPERQLPHPEIFEEVNGNLRAHGSFYPQHVNIARDNLLLDPSTVVFDKRRAFCHWYNSHGAYISDDILFTDEKEFKGNGHNHNFCLNVWCGIVGTTLIGPIFLPLKLKGEEYLDLLSNQLPLILQDLGAERRQRMWFMHDGAPPHKYAKVQQLLHSRFPNRWIGTGGSIPWPPYSSDLNPIDFYVWENIERSIDVSREIKTCDEYEHQILEAFNTFRDNYSHFEMISTFMDLRIATCIDKNGGVIKAPLRNFLRRAN